MSHDKNEDKDNNIKHIRISENENDNDQGDNNKLMNTLSNALDNENNHSILEKTKDKIEEEKIYILNQLQLDDKQIHNMINKLTDFRYIDDFNEIKEGSYIRWIQIPNKDSNSLHIKLRNGGFVCNTKEKNGLMVTIQCNSYYGKPKFFTINFINTIVFQKLTNQEKLLLTIMDYLNK